MTRFNQHRQQGSDKWFTPPEIIDQLGPFDLDPCTSIYRPWETGTKHFCKEYENGLLKNWFGAVWLNPPYGKETGKWLRKLKLHGHGIALIFARTDTNMFFNQVWQSANAVYFLRVRLFFYNQQGEKAKHNCGAPSCLVFYGHETIFRLEKFKIPGKLLVLK